jgi:hypothetical protein
MHQLFADLGDHRVFARELRFELCDARRQFLLARGGLAR